MAKIRFEDLFDFSDDSEIKKLNDGLSQATEELDKFTNRFKSAQSEIKTSAGGLATNLEKVNITTAEGAKSIADNAQSANKLAKEYKELDQATNGVVQSQNQLGKSVNQLQSEYKEQLQTLKSINTETDEGKRAFAAQQKEVAATRAQIKQFNQDLNNQVKSLRQTNTAYDTASKRLSELKKEYKSLAVGIKDGTFEFGKNEKAAQELKTEIDQLDNAIKGLDKNVGESFRNVGNYGSAFEGLGSVLGQLGGTGGGSVGGVVGGIAGSVPVLAGAAVAIGGITAAWDELITTADEVNEQLRLTQSVTGLVGGRAERATAQIRGLANTFDDLEFNDTLVASNALIQTFGLNAAESTDLLAQGIARGLNVQGDFLDQIREYSVQVESAGLGAQDLVNIIQAGTQQSIFSDKAIDAVKEGALRLREQTTATTAALDALGSFRKEQILQAVEAGNTFEAIQLVSAGLNEVELSAAQTGTIIADVFGGAGEDAGINFLKSLQNITTGVDGFNESLTDAQKLQINLVQANQRLAESELALGKELFGVTSNFEIFQKSVRATLIDLFVRVKNVFDPVIQNIRDFASNISEVLETLGLFNSEASFTEVLIDSIAAAFKFLLTNARLAAALLRFFSERLVDIVEASPFLQNALQVIGDGFSRFKEIIVDLPAIIGGVVNAFVQGFKGLGTFVVDSFNIIGDAIGQFVENLKRGQFGGIDLKRGFADAGRAFGDAIVGGFDDGYKFIKDLLREDTEDAVEEVFGPAAPTVSKAKARAEAAGKEISLSLLKGLGLTQQGASPIEQALDRIFSPSEQDKRNKRLLDKAREGLADINEAIKIAEEERQALAAEFFGRRAAQQDEFVASSLEAIQSVLDARVNALLVEQEALQAQRDNELEAAGDNAEARTAIEQKFADEEARLQAQIRQEKRKSAIFAKAVDIANVIQSTARGIAEASALYGSNPFTAPLLPGVIALIAGTGAAQLATILAQPIPAFAKGTSSSPAGPAVVGEQGAETIITPQGQAYITPDQATLVDLPQGSEILTAAQTQRMLAGMDRPELHGSLKSMQAENAETRLNRRLIEQNNHLANLLANKPSMNVTADEDGFKVWIDKAGSKTEYYDKKFR